MEVEPLFGLGARHGLPNSDKPECHRFYVRESDGESDKIHRRAMLPSKAFLFSRPLSVAVPKYMLSEGCGVA